MISAIGGVGLSDAPRPLRTVIGFLLWLVLRVYAITRAKRVIELDGNVYMVRWFLSSRPVGDETGTPGWYLQHIRRADRDRRTHNHPWEWAESTILRGGYVEERFDNDSWDWLRPGWPDRTYGPLERNSLAGDTYHRIWSVTRGGAWTLFHAGPKHGRGWRFRES